MLRRVIKFALLGLLLAVVVIPGIDVTDAKKRGKGKSKGKTKGRGRGKRGGTKSFSAGKKIYSLSLKVDGGGEEEVLADVEKLLAYAKEQRLAQGLQMMLRTSQQKLLAAVEEQRKAAKKAEARAAKKAKAQAAGKTEAATFTSGDRRVRELKESMRAQSCNFVEYKSVQQLALAVERGDVDRSAPFVVRNATASLDRLQRAWTSDTLRAQSDVLIKYYEPKLAKVVMQNQAAEDGQSMEVYQPEMVDFVTYFAKCYSKRKRPGSETEHCEQSLGSSKLPEFPMPETIAPLTSTSMRGDFDTRMAAILASALADQRGLETMLGGQDGVDTFTAFLERTMGASVVLGPSGSGASMRQESHSFTDTLVHGGRRWFIMTMQAYRKIKERAGDDFRPGMAYGFFEEVYSELVEEFGLKFGAKHGVFECDQRPGDVIFIPSGSIRTSLAVSDTLSLSQEIAGSREAFIDFIDAQVWLPAGQVWSAALCFDSPEEIDRILGGFEQVGLTANQFVQAIQQQVSSAQDIARLVLPAVAVCRAAGTSTSGTLCDSILKPCEEKLETIASALGISGTYPLAPARKNPEEL